MAGDRSTLNSLKSDFNATQVGIPGFGPGRYKAQHFKCCVATKLHHIPKIQDLFAIRLWSSRVLSEVASHHSCKSDSIKPRMRTIFAL